MGKKSQHSNRRTTLLIVLIVWSAALIAVLGVSYLSGLNIWLCLGVVIAACVINSIIAEIEDHLRGGFFNPRRKSDGKSESDLSLTLDWVGFAVLGYLQWFDLTPTNYPTVTLTLSV